MKTIKSEAITQAVADLCIEANCRLPEDIQGAIENCCGLEPFDIAKTVLGKIQENYRIADAARCLSARIPALPVYSSK